MKIFIGGSKTIGTIDDIIKAVLKSIYENDCEVLVGDCYGIDSLVQNFFSKLEYKKLTVYTSMKKVRNLLGNWEVKYIREKDEARGYILHRQKDKAMADQADFGFMIWDEKTYGTRNDICMLVQRKKPVIVYLYNRKITVEIKNEKDFRNLEREYY